MAEIRGNGILSFFEYHDYSHIAIYGMGDIGKLLLYDLKNFSIDIDYVIDRSEISENLGVPSYKLLDMLPETQAVIVTPVIEFEHIKAELKRQFNGPIYSLEEIVEWG